MVKGKYEGYEGSYCPFYFDILFGDYGVCLNITAKDLLNHAERTGDFSFPLIEMEANCVSYNKDKKSTRTLQDCSVELSFKDNKLCFKFTFSDNYDVDLTKVSSYTLLTGLLGKYDENIYTAVNGNVAENKSEKTVTSPAKVKLSSVKASDSNAKLKWEKVSGVTGYQVFHSEAKKGTYTKIATIKGAGKITFTADSLSAGTHYYKVRAYKKVDGKNYYGKYSKVKSVKIALATKEDTKTPTATETPTDSNAFADCPPVTVTIAGDQITFPATAKSLENLGWTWEDRGGSISYTKGDYKFTAYDGYEYAQKGQSVSGFKVGDDINVVLDTGISFDSSYDDVVGAYGEPDTIYGDEESMPSYNYKNSNGLLVQITFGSEYQGQSQKEKKIISFIFRYE